MGETRRTRGLEQGPRARKSSRSCAMPRSPSSRACGVHGFTIDAVAKRAGVSRSTIYRRWAYQDRLVSQRLVESVVADSTMTPIPGRSVGTCSFSSSWFVTSGRSRNAMPSARLPAPTWSPRRARFATMSEAACTPRSRVRSPSAGARRGETDFDVEVAIHLAAYGVLMWDRDFGELPSEDDCRRILEIVLASF